MIVSLGIFAVVAVIAVGALLKITDANKKAQTLKSSINNINFAMESMSREIRMGSNYYCDYNNDPSSWDIPASIPDPLPPNTAGNVSCADTVSFDSTHNTIKWLFAFKSHIACTTSLGAADNLIYIYKFARTGQGQAITLLKAEQKPSECGTATVNGGVFTRVVALEVGFNLAQVRLITYDDTSPTPRQPYVKFQFAGSVGSKNRTAFSIQTSASQRNIVVVAGPSGPPPPPPPPPLTISGSLNSGSYAQRKSCVLGDIPGNDYDGVSSTSCTGNPTGLYNLTLTYSVSFSDSSNGILYFNGSATSYSVPGSVSLYRIDKVSFGPQAGSLKICHNNQTTLCSNSISVP